MSDHLVSRPFEQAPLPAVAGFDQPGLPAVTQSPLERPLAALRRYWWLLVVAVPLSAGAGFIAMRFVEPRFEAKATLWIDAEKGGQNSRGGAGPIKAGGLTTSAYIELLKSYRVVDQVVRELGLHIRPAEQRDMPYLAGFRTDAKFRNGSYVLEIDPARKTWMLRTGKGPPIDSGSAADSIGRRLGFHWRLPAMAFQGAEKKSIKFGLSLPRDRAITLATRIVPKVSQGSNFVNLTYDDRSPRMAAQVLNTWISIFIDAAAELKRRNDLEVANILEDQLRYSEKATQEAEAAYQSFRVSTITLPTESAPIASGVRETNESVMQSFFAQKTAYDNLRNDRAAMEKIIAEAAAGTASYEGLLLIPSVASSPGAEELRNAFKTGYAAEARLATERLTYTDEYPTVKELKKSLDVLNTKTIPDLASRLLVTLREREADYERRIQGQTKELQAIPARSIEEMRLERAVTVASGLYATLKNRHAETKLAAVSAVPDVSVLDTAIARLTPVQATRKKMVLGGFGGGMILAFGLVFLLDLVDRRVRYTNQVTNELGLAIVGAVPRLPKGGIQNGPPEKVVQVVEAFRSLRLQVMSSVPTPTATVAVTSAAPRDGKSLISGNLALSFAEAGMRTVLIDGDTRRGTLHKVFGGRLAGGLTDYLEGTIDESEVVRPTNYPNLSFVSCGRRNRRSPELLTSPRLKALVDRLNRQFQVVVIDTPPLAAGIDGYALGAAAGNLLVVLRLGQTERRLVAAKLAMLERLPISIIGAVLNHVPSSGEFHYYSYASGYSIERDEPSTRLALTGPA